MLTSTHEYKRVDGSTIHRIKRYDWVETKRDETLRHRKEYLPEHLSTDRWRIGTGPIPWEPYNAFSVISAENVFIVEGEKCADLLQRVVPKGNAVITSAFGSDASHRTDWSFIRELVLEKKCSIVFIPDCDEPGEKYIHSVARLLHLEEINVIRLGERSRRDGYDVADWLDEANFFGDLPEPVQVSVEVDSEKQADRKVLAGTQSNVKPQLIHETAYDREIGRVSVDERIELNRTIAPKDVQWLIYQFVAPGQTTLIYGDAGVGKTTIVRALIRHIVNGSDPFQSDDQNGNESDIKGRVIWWLGEEDLALTKPKFAAADVHADDVDMLDKGHKWMCDDKIEIQSDGSRRFVDTSPHT